MALLTTLLPIWLAHFAQTPDRIAPGKITDLCARQPGCSEQRGPRFEATSTAFPVVLPDGASLA